MQNDKVVSFAVLLDLDNILLNTFVGSKMYVGGICPFTTILVVSVCPITKGEIRCVIEGFSRGRTYKMVRCRCWTDTP